MDLLSKSNTNEDFKQQKNMIDNKNKYPAKSGENDEYKNDILNKIIVKLKEMNKHSHRTDRRRGMKGKTKEIAIDENIYNHNSNKKASLRLLKYGGLSVIKM